MRQVILFMDNFNEKTVGGKMKKLVIVMRALIFFMIGILLFLFLSPLFVPKTGNSKNQQKKKAMERKQAFFFVQKIEFQRQKIGCIDENYR